MVLKKFSLNEFSSTQGLKNEVTYGVSHQETTFSHSTVADQKHFEQVVTKNNQKNGGTY